MNVQNDGTDALPNDNKTDISTEELRNISDMLNLSIMESDVQKNMTDTDILELGHGTENIGIAAKTGNSFVP